MQQQRRDEVSQLLEEYWNEVLPGELAAGPKTVANEERGRANGEKTALIGQEQIASVRG